MAGIDDRAADLNRRLAEEDEEPAAATEPARKPRARRKAAAPEPAEPSEEGQQAPDEEEGQGEEDDETSQQPEEERSAPAVDPGSGSAAGIVLGVLLYSVLIQYVRGGSAQVRGWLKAKAINEPYKGPNAKGVPT